MPFKPVRVMSFKSKLEDEYDRYLIVSSIDISLILGINDGKISSLGDSDFVVCEPTVHVSTLHDGSYVQVTQSSVVHIRSHVDKSYKNTKWMCDSGR
jgi:hypothetical protein